MYKRQALDKAIAWVAAARRLDAYGYGGSGIIARDIEHRFMRFGMDVHGYSDPHLQVASASLLTNADVVIAVSHTGASLDLLKVLEVVRKNKAKVILITSYLKSPATKLADVVLTGLAKETHYRSEACLLYTSRDFGFPMILSWYLLVRIESKLAGLTQVIGELSCTIAALRS